jgi:hypothetical protein
MSRRGRSINLLHFGDADRRVAALNQERRAAQCRVEIPHLDEPDGKAPQDWLTCVVATPKINQSLFPNSRPTALFTRDRRPQLSYNASANKQKGRSRMNNRQRAQV